MKKTLLENIKKYSEIYGYTVKILVNDKDYVSIAFVTNTVNRTAFVVNYRKITRWELVEFYPMFENTFIRYEKLMKMGY